MAASSLMGSSVTVEPGPAVRADNEGGLLAPAATPAPVVRKLNGAVVAILRNPEVVSLMSGIGLVPTPGTPEEFAAYIQSETRKWTRVVKEAGIKAD